MEPTLARGGGRRNLSPGHEQIQRVPEPGIVVRVHAELAGQPKDRVAMHEGPEGFGEEERPLRANQLRREREHRKRRLLTQPVVHAHLIRTGAENEGE